MLRPCDLARTHDVERRLAGGWARIRTGDGCGNSRTDLPQAVRAVFRPGKSGRKRRIRHYGAWIAMAMAFQLSGFVRIYHSIRFYPFIFLAVIRKVYKFVGSIQYVAPEVPRRDFYGYDKSHDGEQGRRSGRRPDSHGMGLCGTDRASGGRPFHPHSAGFVRMQSKAGRNLWKIGGFRAVRTSNYHLFTHGQPFGLFAGTSGRRRDVPFCIQSRRSDVYSLWQAVQSPSGQVDRRKGGLRMRGAVCRPAVNRGWMDVDWFPGLLRKREKHSF